MREAVTKTTADVSFENLDYLVVLLRHCTDVEAAPCRCHQHKRVVETELLNVDDVALQDFAILGTVRAKQPAAFDLEG